MEKLYKFQGFYFSIQLNITNIKFKYIKKKLSNFFFNFYYFCCNLIYISAFNIILNKMTLNTRDWYFRRIKFSQFFQEPCIWSRTNYSNPLLNDRIKT